SAYALYFPGKLSTRASLDRALPDAARMLAATILQLIVAGLVEGSFSQFSRKTFPLELKTAVAAILFAALLVYLFAPRKKGKA
ncbi:MAG: stage II sporulation protein M, partial [Vicinamibacteria bacterium]